MRRTGHGRSGTSRLYRLNHSRRVTRGNDRRGKSKGKDKSWKKGGRSGGARIGRREHYHLRRRYLHAGLASAGIGAGMCGFDEDPMEEDPFADDDPFLDMELAENFGDSDLQSILDSATFSEISESSTDESDLDCESSVDWGVVVHCSSSDWASMSSSLKSSSDDWGRLLPYSDSLSSLQSSDAAKRSPLPAEKLLPSSKVVSIDGSDSEDNVSAAADEDEGEGRGGPPPLESEDHVHVFFYHSSNTDDQDHAENYINVIENSPYDLKVLSSERDFKPELNHTENLILALRLSQRTVLLCSQEFVENDWKSFEKVLNDVMSEEEKKLKVCLLVLPDVELPPEMLKFHKIFSAFDSDCYESLTKLVSSGPVKVPTPSHLPEPSAPPLEILDVKSLTPVKGGAAASASNHHNKNEQTSQKEPANYPNGAVIRRVTACKYKSYEKPADKPSVCPQYCPASDMLCPRKDPEYIVPNSLTRKGLQVTTEEFDEILTSLTEASQVSFFQKAVECSLPCLYLSTMIITATVTITLWFLVTASIYHYNSGEEDSSSIGEGVFWSFMILVFFVPGCVAVIMLGVLTHLVNYKYLKYRIKIEELNKRFRDTNLVLHCQRARWPFSGKLRLYFIYYNFELCQQTLYCHVHDTLTLNGRADNSSSQLSNIGESTTLKLDRIMKRVNTLTKKFEWDYFDALTTNKLPQVQEKEHRKKGMCFCQYIIHRESDKVPMSIVDAISHHLSSVRKNAFSKSHPRRSTSSRLYLAPLSNKNGVAHFV